MTAPPDARSWRQLAALDNLPRWEPAPALLAVGQRLGVKLEARPGVIARLDGPTVTEDVPGRRVANA